MYEELILSVEYIGGGVVTAVMSEVTSQLQGEYCCLQLLFLWIRKSTNITRHLWVCWFGKNWKFNKTGTSPHGISGIAVLVDQHVAKIYLIHSQFYSCKNSTKRINNLKAFSLVKLEIQQKTNGLLTMSRISSTIFQKVKMAAFVHSLLGNQFCASVRQQWHGNLKSIMYVYLIETKPVHCSAFPALHWYCPPFWYGQLLGYGGDREYADSKHVFTSTSLLVPRIAKSWAGAWERHYAPTWFVDGYTSEWNMVCY